MSRSHRSSSASATCHLEWRPSRWVIAWLRLQLLLVPVCLLASAMPRPIAWPAAVAAALIAYRQYEHYRRLPKSRLRVCAEGPLQLEGVSYAHWKLHWRGPLAFIHWRDERGRLHARSFWPDTLPPALRRELRLATPAVAAVSPAVGMAT